MDMSLSFVKDNIRDLIRDVYYSGGDITESVNFINNSKVLSESNRIMISDDSYSKEKLKFLVSKTIEKYLVEYDSYFKNIFSVLNLTLEDEVEKLNTLFWKMVSDVN